MSDKTLKRHLRILVVEDDELVQAAFCLLVQSFEGIELVGKASSGFEALEQARLLKPDLILMDLNLPDMNGIEATRKIKAVQQEMKVVALSALEDPAEIKRALEGGLDGFLSKKASPRELKMAIETVASGYQYISPQINAIIAKAYLDEQVKQKAPETVLTPREKQVVKRIADGMRMKQIASDLAISERTVEKHSEQARRKLRASTSGELVAIWSRMLARS